MSDLPLPRISYGREERQVGRYRLHLKGARRGRWAVAWGIVLSVGLTAQDWAASQAWAMRSGLGDRQSTVMMNPPLSDEVAISTHHRVRIVLDVVTHPGVIELVQAKSSATPRVTLLQKFGTHPKRTQVIADCVKIIEQEVANKSGISGMAISASHRMVETFKPGFVSIVMDVLFDDFCRALQPIVDDAHASQRPIGLFFNAQSDRVAEALLSITDRRARDSKLLGVKATYEQLRGMAKRNVVEAVPRVAALIERHAGRG